MSTLIRHNNFKVKRNMQNKCKIMMTRDKNKQTRIRRQTSHAHSSNYSKLLSTVKANDFLILFYTKI